MTKKTPLISQLLAIELFVVWFMLTSVYFIFFTNIASELLGEKYGEVLAKLVGIAFGYIVSNGFFPIGFAKGLTKHFEKNNFEVLKLKSVWMRHPHGFSILHCTYAPHTFTQFSQQP